MRFDIITIFPDILDSYINESILVRAQSLGLIDIDFHTPREFAKDAHQSVDDRPYGGGAGMVMMFEPIAKTIEKLVGDENVRPVQDVKRKIVLLAANGEQFTQEMAREWAELDQLVLIAGRYEGVDARIEEIVDEKISIGPYVLAGGELPAMVVTEAVARNIKGVLGKEESLAEESHDSEGYLEYPQYTRPEVVEWNNKKLIVPEVLLSGHHEQIQKWRKDNSSSQN